MPSPILVISRQVAPRSKYGNSFLNNRLLVVVNVFGLWSLDMMSITLLKVTFTYRLTSLPCLSSCRHNFLLVILPISKYPTRRNTSFQMQGVICFIYKSILGPLHLSYFHLLSDFVSSSLTISIKSFRIGSICITISTFFFYCVCKRFIRIFLTVISFYLLAFN